MAPKSVTFRRHDHLVSVLFGDLLSHSYNITFSMFLDLVTYLLVYFSYFSWWYYDIAIVPCHQLINIISTLPFMVESALVMTHEP